MSYKLSLLTTQHLFNYPPNRIKTFKGKIKISAYYPTFESLETLTLTKRKLARLIRKGKKCQIQTT